MHYCTMRYFETKSKAGIPDKSCHINNRKIQLAIQLKQVAYISTGGLLITFNILSLLLMCCNRWINKYLCCHNTWSVVWGHAEYSA